MAEEKDEYDYYHDANEVKPSLNSNVEKPPRLPSEASYKELPDKQHFNVPWAYIGLTAVFLHLALYVGDIAPIIAMTLGVAVVFLASFFGFDDGRAHNETPSKKLATAKVSSVTNAHKWLKKVKDQSNLGPKLDLLEQLMHGQEETAAYKAAVELLETDLPKLVEFYQNVPETLRQSDYLGQTPEAILQAGLERLDHKADALINQLKTAPLDQLAIHGRYLENLHTTSTPLAA